LKIVVFEFEVLLNLIRKNLNTLFIWKTN